MKKLIILAGILLMPLTTMANDLNYGVSPEGCYYANEDQTLALSKDASLMFDANACQRNYHMSSVWYVKRNNMEMPDNYWNRIKAMKMLRSR